jgi:lysophospholipase L1-like esterase
MKNIKRSLGILLITLVMVEGVEAQDWANLERYQQENIELETVKDENRVVFMGNSITEGWSVLHPSFFDNASYINRGIGGQTTPQMLIRFRADVIDLKPKAVVILAGTNDIAGNTGPSTLEMIADNIFSMAEIAEANGIRVVLSSVLAVYDFPWAPGKNPDTRIPALNKLIKQYANSKGHVYLDYFTPMVDAKNGLIEAYTYDGCHPNKKGYEIMAPLAKEAIRKALLAK